MVAKSKPKDMDLMKLMGRFHSDAKCRAYLEDLRWPDGVRCPRCEGATISRIQKRNQFDCDSCRYQFSVTAGTIFHDSHLPLPKWFAAIYLMCESKKGISANQMKRTLGVSYKTAWYLCHRIRAAMQDAAPIPRSGTVEMDETYVGGKRRGVGKGSLEGKTMVLGAIERGGGVRFKVDPRVTRISRKVIEDFLEANVADDAVAIYTDEHPAYGDLSDEDTRHETVNHSAEEWVRADVHTNSIEGVWSLFKRSIVGSYHHLSVKHLPAYLDEVAFRFDNRHNAFLFRDTLLKLIEADNLPYQELVEKPG